MMELDVYNGWRGGAVGLRGVTPKRMYFPDLRNPKHQSNFTTTCTQNIYISLGEWLYQTVQEVSDAIPGLDTTLQTVEGIIIINKKEE